MQLKKTVSSVAIVEEIGNEGKKMISRIKTSILTGIDAIPGDVEADVSLGGLAQVKLVGLAKAAAKETTSRIQTAMRNSGYHWPGPKVIINLAPADVRKDSASFDLPVALATMMAGEIFRSDIVSRYLILGELSLDGRLRPVRGALASAMLARRMELDGIILPVSNAKEAAVVNDLEVIAVNDLTEAVGFLSGEVNVEPAVVDIEQTFAAQSDYTIDFGDVKGQHIAKRAMTIAAAGHHNMLMLGPPGSGKSMLSKRIPTILPPLSLDESLETTRIYSARGLLAPGESLMTRRPVRTPHHTASIASMAGGGSVPMPGEISLAHHGVLFLDEFPEFSRATLECIRQPLEDRSITLPRLHSTINFPASIMLVAAMNPCPCGYFNDPKRRCRCSTAMVEKYMNRVSGPLVDRIDIHVEVSAVSWDELRGRGGEDELSSKEIRRQVIDARKVQRKRFKGDSITTNGTMSHRDIRAFCRLDRSSESLLRQAMTELGLSARAHDKVLRVARTIADLESNTEIKSHHIAEAVQYRRLDRRV